MVHPHLLRFARAALGDHEIRVYLAQAWAKYSGVTDYEQPLHRDGNHSLVPVRSDATWSQMEGFVYLSDVDSAGRTDSARVDAPHSRPACWYAALTEPCRRTCTT